jgi:hypothetical protein
MLRTKLFVGELTASASSDFMSSPSIIERAGIDIESIEHLDREQVFLLYANFAGDISRTAAALNISATAVLRMAEEEHWLAKLEPIIALSKSQRPGDWERACNRAVNFVQAHRMRLFLQRTVKRMSNMSDEEVEELLVDKRFNKDGEEIGAKFNTRALADLMAAIEKAHALTYQALGDTAPERAKRAADVDDGDSAQDIHAKLAQAMASAGMSNSPRALLFDAQVQQGEAIAGKAAKDAVRKVNPNDNDDH